MNIQIKSSNGSALIPIETILLAERKVFIEGEITQKVACDFVKKIMFLNGESNEDINLFINSPGGEITAGMLMYDAIQGSKAPIRMICTGRAYSMGAVIFASGSNGRYMLPNSELMLHEPLLGNSVGGSASSIKSISDSLMENRKKMNRILAKHTGRSEKEIEEATGFDHYYSPEESIAFGLADEIREFNNVI